MMVAPWPGVLRKGTAAGWSGMSSCLGGRRGRGCGVGGRCGGDHEREERWERVLIEDEMLEGVCWSEATLQRTDSYLMFQGRPDGTIRERI